MRHDLISYEWARTIYTESWQFISSGVSTSMGRSEIPVELMPPTVRFLPICSSFMEIWNDSLCYRLKKGRWIIAGEIEVQVKDKFCFTVDEASEYFNIGKKKMRKLIAKNMDSGFVIQPANKKSRLNWRTLKILYRLKIWYQNKTTTPVLVWKY